LGEKGVDILVDDILDEINFSNQEIAEIDSKEKNT